jgi:hypothetical protein
MRWVPVNQGGTLAVYAPRVPDAAGTFTVASVTGGVIQSSGAAGFTALSTTVNATAPAGSRTLTLASTTGVVAGRLYLLGGPEAVGGEFVLVTKVTGATTLSLARPLRTARATGDTFASTRVTFPITAATAATAGRNFRVEWEWVSGGEDQDPLALPFDVTRYSPVTYASVESVRRRDPLASKYIPEGTWMPDTLADAWTMVLRRVAAKVPPGGVVGTVDLTIPHEYFTLVLLLEPGAGTTEADAQLARLETRFSQELDAAMATLSLDEDQDGDAKTGEPGWSTHSIRFLRR